MEGIKVKGKPASMEHEISRIEKELAGKRGLLNQHRRRLPPLKVKDYALKGPGGKRVKLSSLFGGKEELILIHNMGKTCPYCTMWADGFNGVLKHLEDRAAFVVISPDDPAVQEGFAHKRGWEFKMFSSKGSSFAKDMGFQTNEDQYLPGVSVFRKDKDGKIFRISRAVFGPGDFFCIVWHFFDLLPGGPGDWQPKFNYEASLRRPRGMPFTSPQGRPRA